MYKAATLGKAADVLARKITDTDEVCVERSGIAVTLGGALGAAAAVVIAVEVAPLAATAAAAGLVWSLFDN